MERGEERLGRARATLDDVDEVEGARLARARSLHLHERRDGVSHVREQDVLARRRPMADELAGECAGRDEVEEEPDDKRQEDSSAERAPQSYVAPQNRNRFSPPSTTRVCPVT